MKRLNSRAQLLLVAILIGVAFISVLFYVLNRTNQRVEQTTGSFPINEQYSYVDQGGNVTNTIATDAITDQSNDQLRQITNEPVAGYQIINDLSEGYSIRYIQADTGLVYDYIPSLNQSTQLTTTTLPRITRATWLSNQDVLLQYNQSGQNVNYLGTINLESGELTGQIFPARLVSITATNVDGVSQIYYATSLESGGSNLYRYNSDDGRSTFLQQFDFSQLSLITNANRDQLYVTTKPSSNNPRQVILVLTDNNQSYQVIATKNDTNNGVVIGQGYALLADSSNQSYVIDLITSEEVLVNGQLLGNQCVADATEFVCIANTLTTTQRRGWPFNWYRGEITPNQSLVIIDAKFGDSQELLVLGEQLSSTNLKVTPEYVYFVDRQTGRLFEAFKRVNGF